VEVKRLHQLKHLRQPLRLEVPALWWPPQQGLWPWSMVLAAAKQAIALATLE
jgi:hypothetical protein